MQEIVGKYPEDSLSPYLLPVLRYPFKDTHKHYRNVMSGINRNLKEIAKLADISVPLSPSFMGKRSQRQEHSDFGYQ